MSAIAPFIIIIIIFKDLLIHRPQLASTNRSYLQVNYIFLVFPSEIEPFLEDSNRRRLDNFPRKCVPLLDTPKIKGVRLGTSQAVLCEDSFQLETVVSARTGTRREPLRDGCLVVEMKMFIHFYHIVDSSLANIVFQLFHSTPTPSAVVFFFSLLKVLMIDV